MTDALVRFVRSRLDEDEKAARKAAELCGCHPDAPSWSYSDEATDGRIVVADDPHPDVKRTLGKRWGGTYHGLFAAQHVVRHDPARVLDEVEAKRQILILHRSVMRSDLTWENGNPVKPMETCHTCDALTSDPNWPDSPCWTLRYLALPYADHPDYREDWRP